MGAILSSKQAKLDSELGPLAKRHWQMEVHISEEDLDRIADLALRMTLEEAKAALLPMYTQNARPYLDRTSVERAAMRGGVKRVVQALVLLGWIEQPGGLEIP
jgi:hypothetical protein